MERSITTVSVYAAHWEADTDPYLHYLTEKIKTRSTRFLHFKDAKLALLGKLLLLVGLSKRGITGFSLADLRVSESNRPYFPGGPDFNITHSGDYVLCCISNEGRIGIDL